MCVKKVEVILNFVCWVFLQTFCLETQTRNAKKMSDNEEEKKTQEDTMGWQRAQASRSNNISLVDEGSTMVKRHCK